MKKGLLLALVLVFGMASVSFGVTLTGNVSQQGSLLIFPKIDVSGNRDTYIQISNGNSVPVWIKCYWVTGNQQNFADFFFQLTANQPIKFSALNGIGLFDPIPVTVPPFPTEFADVGELKCWAEDATGENQIRFDFLSGSAKVVDFDAQTAYEYNAWSFQGKVGAQGAAIGTGGTILLDNLQYDACPKYFLGNFVASGADFGFFQDTDLTLVPCKQDIRQNRAPTKTKAKFEIWNENETKYTGAFACVTCWYENFLSSISSKFTFRSLHTAPARFRVWGVADNGTLNGNNCGFTGSVNSPLIGLLVEYLDFTFGTPDEATSFLATTASTGFTSGVDPSGFIFYDPQTPPEPGPRR